MFAKLSHTYQRITVSLIFSVLLILVIWFSYYPLTKPVFVLTVMGFVSVAIWEYYQITKAKEFKPLVSIGVATASLYVLAVFLDTQYPNLSVLPFAVFASGFLVLFVRLFAQEREPLSNLAVTVFGWAYLAIPLSLLIHINYFFPEDSQQQGRFWLLYILIVTKMTDTGGYFIGKYFGKHKLAKQISPKKTIEGAAGGLVFAVIASVLFPLIANASMGQAVIQLSLLQSLLLGSLISVLGQIGDLGESLLKRDAGVKDSNQLPGLGGILDIVDSLVFTIPLLFIFMKIEAGASL